jgi:diguanylate cyclase (GGDEF)-like protein
MAIKLSSVFDEYPNPFYIVKPIIANGKSEDFVYEYVNNAFCFFLGRNRDELMGRKFGEVFGTGEEFWLNSFMDVAVGCKHLFINNVSTVINRKLYTELFHVEPDMCGCIIHDYEEVADSISATENEILRRKANTDFLTGFYNRFYLNELKNDFSGKTNVGFSYIDINNLKAVNDLLGHSSGDELIKKVADNLREYFDGSFIFRVGGDEFVVITYGLDKDSFIRLAKQAKEFFSKDDLAAVGYKFYEKVDDFDACIGACDDLMYKHKKIMKFKRNFPPV